MTSSKIARRLIIFWHDKNDLPGPILESIQHNQSINPGVDVLVADDRFMEQEALSTDSELLRLYQELSVPAARSDLARLVLLQRYGGLYIDAAMETKYPIHQLPGIADQLILVRRDDRLEPGKDPQSAHLINGIIGAEPGSPFITRTLDLVIENLKTRKYDRVWYATGAHNLNSALAEGWDETRVKFLYFSDLARDFFTYRRVAGVSNAWRQQQKHGLWKTP